MRIVYWLGWVFICASLSSAESPVDTASFSELIESDIVFGDDEDIDYVEAELWEKYLNAAREDAGRKAQHDRRELVYGDKIMRFSLEKIRLPASSGYPVYIALHGGGTAPSGVNDSQWQHMKIYYRDSIDSGIYIAPRGVTDTWNLHFRDESYPLYDRLIENLIAYEGADPNRIYLLGFSAGGDGVYQVVPRMPDRFAAANMSAGHHNWIRFDNLLNTPFLLQVGERDGAYNRNRVAAENFVVLEDLQARYQGYVHDLFIHYQAGHNGWYDNDPTGNAHNIIKDPRAWLMANDRSFIAKDTNAVHWLKNYRRQSLPNKLIWDLSTRSPRSATWGKQYVENAVSINEAKDLFYWLAIDTPNVVTGRIEAEIVRDDNAIVFNDIEGVSDLRILLHSSMLDFSRPVSVYLKGEKILEVNPTKRMQVMAQTLLERGDKSFIFHDEIEIHVPAMHNSNDDGERFSYCSDGRCSIRSASDFQKSRDFPLELNYTCKNDHQYALTFDDGPSVNYPAVIDILARHGVTATFFVVGKNLSSEEGKNLIRHAYTSGHEIANHSFSHRSLVALTKEEISNELLSTQDAILQSLGDDEHTRLASSIIRPPFGNINPSVQEVIREIGFTSVRWSSDRYDWTLSPNQGHVITDRVRQHLDFIDAAAKATINRSIIDLNHDSSGATLSVLDEIIPLLQSAGFQLVSVSKCLGLSA